MVNRYKYCGIIFLIPGKILECCLLKKSYCQLFLKIILWKIFAIEVIWDGKLFQITVLCFIFLRVF